VNKIKSSFLFATPTFTSGFARALDLCGDCKAVWADWSIVGQDISLALKEFENFLPADVNKRNELCGVGEQMSFF
jgi:hypothetical protein